MEPTRIPPAEANREIRERAALLVCASAKALKGGVEAWKNEGYKIAPS